MKKNPGAEAVHGFAEFQCVEHLQFGKPDIHPVEVIEQVADEDEGDQTQGNAFVDGFLSSTVARVAAALCDMAGSLFIMIFATQG